MIKSLSLLLSLALTLSSYASSTVYETVEYTEVFQKIEELGEDHGQKNVLIVFDIDDTLLVIEHCEKEDGTLTRGIGKLFACPSEHTEKKISHKISDLQKEGFATVALTARGASLVKATQRELARKHPGLKTISFKKAPFKKNAMKIAVPRTRRCKQGEVAPCLKGEVSTKPRLVDGVMYANGTHKGLALKALLELKGLEYDAIVFVDDRKKNTDDVHEVFVNQDKTEVISYLYLRHRD
jgi:hypothetical protein